MTLRKWLVSHTDHLLISVLVSLPTSIAVNVITHHIDQILHFLHVPAGLIRWLGY